jgi:hypothetical protein
VSNEQNKKILAVDLARAETRMDQFGESVKGLGETLVEAKRGSATYEKSVKQLNNSLASLFETDSDTIKKAGLTNKEMEGIIAGDPKAFKSAGKKITKAVVEGMVGKTGGDANKVLELVGGFKDGTITED